MKKNIPFRWLVVVVVVGINKRVAVGINTRFLVENTWFWYERAAFGMEGGGWWWRWRTHG